jgi:hypothetical protein
MNSDSRFPTSSSLVNPEKAIPNFTTWPLYSLHLIAVYEAGIGRSLPGFVLLEIRSFHGTSLGLILPPLLVFLHFTIQILTLVFIFGFEEHIGYPLGFPLPLLGMLLIFPDLALGKSVAEVSSSGSDEFPVSRVTILETSSSGLKTARLFSSWILKYISSRCMVIFWGAIMPNRICRPRTPRMVIFMSSPMVTLSPNFRVKISIAPPVSSAYICLQASAL